MDNSPTEKKSEKGNIGRAAGVVAFYTSLSRILGLIRDMVIAVFFGATMSADAFFVAFRLPNMLRRFTAEGSMTIAFIPVFTEYLKNRSKEEAIELARAIFTLLSIILVIMTILGVILAPWIVRLIAHGFGDAGTKYELTVLLTRIMFPYIIPVSLVAFFMGILNSLRHFAAPAAAPVFLNLGIIGSTFLIAPRLSEPVIGTAIGVLIGGVLQVMLQLPWIYKKGVSLKPLWKPGHPAVRRIGMLILPALLGSAVYQINLFVMTLLASFLPNGSISWLYYADRLVGLPLGVFAIALSTAVLPSLSRQAAEKDRDAFRDTLDHTIKLTFFVSLPSMAGLIILGKPIIQLFFQRGAFGAVSTDMTAYALFFFALGLWASSGVKVIVSGFYALQDTITPVKVSIITFISYILFGIYLMGPLKHGGLALALSLSSALNFIMLVFLLKRRLSDWSLTPIITSVSKILLSSVIMGVSVAYMQLKFFPYDSNTGTFNLMIQVSALVISGIIIYCAAAWILRCRELSVFSDLIKSRK